MSADEYPILRQRSLWSSDSPVLMRAIELHKERLDCTRLCNIRVSHRSNHNCRFKLYLNQRVIDSCDVQGSRLRHQFCPRRDNRLWFASAFRLLRLGCGLSKLVCDTILAHLALFDESIYDGGPAQLIEKRRQCGIDFLQPLYMDYLMQNQYAHCIYDMLEISIECTAECDCVFIADEYNLTDTPRL